ncbi:MAG: TIGR04282 family arsenosugar biosynthesis glycosyltransferase [Deltaproteobacteria bacterium]|nr:TIGR04282 family arsenosugar biosynthesis glycosyltransferase [Deltaproteobacteria bacterium]
MRCDEALIVMGKIPRAGAVKTRLCPPLAAREAAALYGCMLADTGAEMSSLRGVRRILFLAPLPGMERFEWPPFARFERLPQTGSDLGERMDNAADVAFRGGARRVAIVGADCPALSADTVRSAFREIRDGAAVVFGPSTDGGFYLVGLSSPDIRPFGGISWSTPEVLAQAAERCRSLEAPFSFLPPERDVDVYEDLLALREWTMRRNSPPCRLTREWVTAYFSRGGGRTFVPRGRTGGPPPGSRPPRGG